MDQYLSMVIIAIITGIFSIITVIIQKRQDKVINKIDEQTMFIEKEKRIRQKLEQKEKERSNTIYNVLMLVLETNVIILKMSSDPSNPNIDPEIMNQAVMFKEAFKQINGELEKLNKEHEMVLELSEELKDEYKKNHKKE